MPFRFMCSWLSICTLTGLLLVRYLNNFRMLLLSAFVDFAAGLAWFVVTLAGLLLGLISIFLTVGAGVLLKGESDFFGKCLD